MSPQVHLDDDDVPLAVESTARSGPRLAIFLMALPDALPMEHGSTFTQMLEGQIAQWAGLPGRLTEDGLDFPQGWSGRRFVSLKIWQLKESSLEDELRALNAAFTVAGTITGEAPSDRTPGSGDADSYRTVVEMVTPVDETEIDTPGGNVGEPLTRCLSFLTEIFRAYRVARSVLVPELTYQRLPPFAVLLLRDPLAGGSGIIGPGTVVVLDHLNVRNQPAPEVLEPQQVGDLYTVLGRLLKGDPILVYAERVLEAERAFKHDGDLGNAVVQLAMAIEVLFDRVLSLLIWEQSLGNPDFDAAATAVGMNLKPKVRTQFGIRLGGSWDVTMGALGAWDTKIARLRGRVVHGGYRPTHLEVTDAFAAAKQVEEFVITRLLANLSTYPRTNLLILGQPGLERRGAWTARIRSFVEQRATVESDWIDGFVDWRSQVELRL